MDFSRHIKQRDTSAVSTARPRHILFASAEVAPYSKTGGLGDVAQSLPRALALRGHHVYVLTPLYRQLDADAMRLARRLRPLVVPRKGKNQGKVEAAIWEGRTEAGVRMFFLDYPPYFGRDGLYGGYDDKAFEDNAERFAFFARAMVEFAVQFSVPVDVLHCNDWHTALAPAYVEQFYPELRKHVATVLSIHNLAYQGVFEGGALAGTGLTRKNAEDARLMAGEQLNFLQSGIAQASTVATVSPSYAREIQTPEGGMGLDALLAERGEGLRGILNGADYSVWAPDVDHHISVRYDIETLNGKRQNKAELQHHFGLPVRPTLPLLGVVARLTEQKGFDILLPAVQSLLAQVEDEQQGFQLVVLGEGDARYASALEALVKRFPRRVAFHQGYDEAMAHRIQAGSDMLLVPSRFEPCGLTQLYAMRYGTVPVVHATGGLRDSVRDASAGEEGTGFVFEQYSEAALAEAITRATAMYRNYRRWRPMMVQAMRQDFSWAHSARAYEALYEEAISRLTATKASKRA